MDDQINLRILRMIMALYDILGRVLIPFLRKNNRLKDGFEQRCLLHPLPAADVWIQAASGGEAYLASTIAEALSLKNPVRILVTTNTRQGMEIIGRFSEKINGRKGMVSVSAAYFPFDRPSVMRRALEQVAPKLAVLLETEIWPGFLYAARLSGIPVALVNARMTEKSFRIYRKFGALLKAVGPWQVLAISGKDAERFSAVFGAGNVSVMPNIKFDGVVKAEDGPDRSLRSILPGSAPFLVLGSIRQEEEKDVARMISFVRKSVPDAVIGLFPRHMHRVGSWVSILEQMGAEYVLKSECVKGVRPGTVLIWDVFGELASAYAAADAVFVGGSLAPLGGQNFLEPMIYGVIPVIGPFWDNFSWVGDEVFRQGLVIRAKGWQDAAGILVRRLKAPARQEAVLRAAARYIESRRGGTEIACKTILSALRNVN